MPRVPVYETPTAQPGSLPAAYQQVPASLDDAMLARARQGEQIGQGLRTVANTLSAYEEKERIEKNEADVKSATAEFNGAATGILYDEQNGYLYRQGKNALGDAKTGTVDALRKSRDTIAGKLTDPRAQRMFAMSSETMLASFGNQIESHAGREHQTYLMTSSKERVGSAANLAVKAYNVGPGADNSVYDTQVGIVRAELTDQGQNLLGLRGEQLTKFVKEGLSDVYLATAEHLANTGKGEASRTYLQQHADAVTNVEKLDQVRARVDASADTDAALRMALTLRGSFAERRTALRKLALSDGPDRINANTYKLANQEIDAQEADYNRARTEAVNTAMTNATLWLMQNPTASVTQVPRSLLNTITQGGKLADLVSFAGNGNRFVTDAETWTSVALMPDKQLAQYTPEQIVEAYRGRLSDEHLASLVARTRKARSEPLDAEGLQLTTTADYLKQRATAAGMLPANGRMVTDDQNTAYLNFTNEVQRRVRDYELTKLNGDRKASRDELTNIVDNVLMDKVFVKDTWSSDDEVVLATLGYENLSPDDKKDVYVNVNGRKVSLTDISEQDRIRYSNKLRQDGFAVTEANIAALWAADNKAR